MKKDISFADYADEPVQPEIFPSLLRRFIKARGLSVNEIADRAHMDPETVERLQSKKGSNPDKDQVVALSLALHLEWQQAKDLLKYAGYEVSKTDRYDDAVAYCLEHGIYDIYELNQLLVGHGLNELFYHE